MTEYSSVLQLIEDLNKQVYHFENMKSEQESRWKEFRAKEDNFSRLASEAAGVLDAVAGLVKNNEELKNHLFSLKDAFEDLSQRPPSNFYREDENGREDLKSEREDEVDVGYDEEEPMKREFAGQVMSELETSLPNEKQEQRAVEEYSNGQSEQEVELTANFPEAHHVELALAPWNWSSVPMERCDQSWKTRARIPSGNEVMFKFIVDGEWKCSQEYPIVRDHHNNENNFINCM